MSNIKKEIREYILNRRTISFANIIDNFNIPEEDLICVIENMESAEDIRIINSSCTMDCNSCNTNTCDDKVGGEIKPTSILVSINRLF